MNLDLGASFGRERVGWGWRMGVDEIRVSTLAAWAMAIRVRRQREDEAGGKMGLYQIVEALLMMTNALAILNEDRFLAPSKFLILPEFTALRLVACGGNEMCLKVCTVCVNVWYMFVCERRIPVAQKDSSTNFNLWCSKVVLCVVASRVRYFHLL